jgi:very-short-patch-repair endonuclease
MLHGPKTTQRKARALRADLSLPEVLLWRALRTRSGGFKFRRQHPAGPYVLDFFCAERRLAIEIDGESHNRGDRPERDSAKDTWLSANGVEVCRIPAAAVLREIDSVVQHIVHLASARTPLHRPSGGRPPLAGEDL